MKAAVLHSGADVRVEDVPDLKPGTGEVLCRVGAAGHLRLRPPRLPGGEGRAARAGKYPHVAPGHELAGTVVALGDGVRG